MRTLLLLIVGIAVGVVAYRWYQQHPSGNVASTSATTGNATDQAIAKTRAVASEVSDTITAKIKEWHLTPDDIRADLAKSGQVARENTSRLREKVSDARVVGTIKAKFALDRDLKAGDVTIACDSGDVTLSGTVTSQALVGRAVALAMDTEGVHHVTAKLSLADTGAPK